MERKHKDMKRMSRDFFPFTFTAMIMIIIITLVLTLSCNIQKSHDDESKTGNTDGFGKNKIQQTRDPHSL